MGSPVRGYTTSHTPGKLRAAIFFLPLDTLRFVLGFFSANFPRTFSPK